MVYSDIVVATMMHKSCRVQYSMHTHTLGMVFQGIEYFPNWPHSCLFAHESNVRAGIAISCLSIAFAL